MNPQDQARMDAVRKLAANMQDTNDAQLQDEFDASTSAQSPISSAISQSKQSKSTEVTK